MVPRVETSGEWPASIRLGSPAAQGTVQTACSAPAGLLVGFGTCPAAFLPPPRTYTNVFSSEEKLSEESSWPSSSLYLVSCRAANPGACATQMFRLPCWSKTQATRLLFFAAVKSDGNGALRICSSVKDFWAFAPAQKAKATTATAKAERFILFSFNPVEHGRKQKRGRSKSSIHDLRLRDLLHGDAQPVERPGNLQHMPCCGSFLLAYLGCFPGLSGDTQLRVRAKTERAFHRGLFKPRIQLQPLQDHAAIANQEGAFPRRPA